MQWACLPKWLVVAAHAFFPVPLKHRLNSKLGTSVALFFVGIGMQTAECWMCRNVRGAPGFSGKVNVTSSRSHNIGNLTSAWFPYKLSFYPPSERQWRTQGRGSISSGKWKQNWVPKTILAQVIDSSLCIGLRFAHRGISKPSWVPL